MSFFGPTAQDLADLWEAQGFVYQTQTNGPPMEPPPSRTVPDDPFKPTDDPLYPAPLPLAGAWQCPGCGVIYSASVNRCECQTHRWSVADNKIRLYPTHTSEMP